MGGDRFLKALKIITALEHRNNSPARGLVGDVQQLSGHPGEILGLQVQRSQGIAIMRVEARRDDDQFWGEFPQMRQDAVFERRAELRAAVLRNKWRIDDVVMLAALA